MRFPLDNPDLALIRFVVFEEDSFGEGQFLGQACYPVQCLRTGFRSVILKNEYSEELHLASLLVHIQFTAEKVCGNVCLATDTALRSPSSNNQCKSNSLSFHE